MNRKLDFWLNLFVKAFNRRRHRSGKDPGDKCRQRQLRRRLLQGFENGFFDFENTFIQRFGDFLEADQICFGNTGHQVAAVNRNIFGDFRDLSWRRYLDLDLFGGALADQRLW